MKTLTLIFAAFFCSNAEAQIDEAIKFIVTCPNGNSDESIVRLKNEATTAFDPAWDAWKLFSGNDLNPSVYTETDDQYALTVNTIPHTTTDSIVHLYIRAKITSGTYTLSTEKLGTWPSNISIALKDLQTNEVYNLNQNITHDFDIVADPNNDIQRFEIFYSPRAEIDVTNDELTITNAGNLNWQYQLHDENMLMLFSGVSYNEDHTVSGLSNGNYALFVTDDYQLIDTINFSVIDGIEPEPDTGIGFSEMSLDSFTARYFNGEIIISTPEYSGQTIHLEIYNTIGQLIYEQKDGITSATSMIPFSGSSGIVFLRLLNGPSEITFKLYI